MCPSNSPVTIITYDYQVGLPPYLRKMYGYMRVAGLVVVTMKATVVWHLKVCCLKNSDKHFGGDSILPPIVSDKPKKWDGNTFEKLVSNVSNVSNVFNVSNVSNVFNVSHVSNVFNVSNVSNVSNVFNVSNVSNVFNVSNISNVFNVSNVSNP
jgi:hypothetical protein